MAIERFTSSRFNGAPGTGVGSTAPYGHDGRSINLEEVILRHSSTGAEPEAIVAVNAWNQAIVAQRATVKEYLASLILFPPDDTASNLDPGDPNNPAFPQRGHGSIKLGVLFNNPADAE